MSEQSCKITIGLFKQACENLARHINEQLFEGCREPYWVGDEIGGLCDFGDADFLTPSDMILIIEHDVTYDQYVEWREAGLDYNRDREPSEYKNINLRSWLMGCRYEMLDNK